MWLGAMFLALQNPAKRRTRLQRLDGGLPLKTHRLRYGMHAAHHMCSRRGHAWGADKALQRAVLQGEVMTIVFADAALPNLRSAGLLPGGDLAAELGMMCREILGTVVTLPIMSPSLLRRCSFGRKAPTFVEYMDAVARFDQGLGAGKPRYACANDCDGFFAAALCRVGGAHGN
jgi:hypothetical protein